MLSLWWCYLYFSWNMDRERTNFTFNNYDASINVASMLTRAPNSGNPPLSRIHGEAFLFLFLFLCLFSVCSPKRYWGKNYLSSDQVPLNAVHLNLVLKNDLFRRSNAPSKGQGRGLTEYLLILIWSFSTKSANVYFSRIVLDSTWRGRMPTLQRK